MNWTTLNTTLLNLAVTNNFDANFQTEMPDIINYAENRIYRDLDFLQTRMSQQGPALIPGVREVSMAALVYPVIVLERMNIITPVGGTTTGLTYAAPGAYLNGTTVSGQPTITRVGFNNGTMSANKEHGLKAINVVNLSLTDMNFWSNADSGIYTPGCSNVLVSAVRSYANVNYGWDGSTGTNLAASASSFQGNTVGSTYGTISTAACFV